MEASDAVGGAFRPEWTGGRSGHGPRPERETDQIRRMGRMRRLYHTGRVCLERLLGELLSGWRTVVTVPREIRPRVAHHFMKMLFENTGKPENSLLNNK